MRPIDAERPWQPQRATAVIAICMNSSPGCASHTKFAAISIQMTVSVGVCVGARHVRLRACVCGVSDLPYPDTTFLCRGLEQLAGSIPNKGPPFLSFSPKSAEPQLTHSKLTGCTRKMRSLLRELKCDYPVSGDPRVYPLCDPEPASHENLTPTF